MRTWLVIAVWITTTTSRQAHQTGQRYRQRPQQVLMKRFQVLYQILHNNNNNTNNNPQSKGYSHAELISKHNLVELVTATTKSEKLRLRMLLQGCRRWMTTSMRTKPNNKKPPLKAKTTTTIKKEAK
eukprot:PhF_6_TR37864/c0_g1_i1/m.56434